MTDDLELDPFDPTDEALRRRFGAGTVAPDPDAMLETMRPRLRQARTRRRASFATAFAGAAVILVIVAFALSGSGGGDSSVKVPPATRGPVTSTAPATPTTAPTGGAATPDTLPGAVDDHGADSSSVTTPTAPDVTPPTEAPPAAAPATPAPAPPQDATYSSDGGSIVVHLADGQVSLVSSSPAAGYSPSVHDNGPTRVEVRFSNGSTEWRVRVDVVNGQLVPDISQHG